MPDIWAVYVVANEADHIADSIRSVKAYVDGFVVVDALFQANPTPSDPTISSSTDATPEIFRHLTTAEPTKRLTYYASPVRLTEVQARNLALDLVPPGDWALVIDGDERLCGDWSSMICLLEAIRSGHPVNNAEAYWIQVFTTAVNVNKGADTVTPDEFSTRPIISTAGPMPRLFRVNPILGYTVIPGASTPILSLTGPRYDVPNGEMFLINDHVRQSYASYQNDYVWETKGVILT